MADPLGGGSPPLRWPSQWRTAAYAALGAGGGILVWNGIHGEEKPHEPWQIVVLAFAMTVVLSTFFVEPLVHRLTRPEASAPHRRKIRVGLRWVRGSAIVVTVALFSEVYQSAALANLRGTADWLGVCALSGLMTRAWLDGLSDSPPQAARKAARIAPLAVLLFGAVGLLVDLVHGRPDFGAFMLRAVFSSGIWALLGFWGGRILERLRAPLVSRLTLAVGLAGSVLTLSALVLRAMFFPGVPLHMVSINVFVTIGWWVGLWLCLVPLAAHGVKARPGGMADDGPGWSSPRLVIGAAMAVAVVAVLLPYAIPEPAEPVYDVDGMFFVANADPLINPWNPHNQVLPSGVSLDGRTSPYLHVILRVKYSSARKQDIRLTCSLADPKGASTRVLTPTVPLPDPHPTPPGLARWVVTFEKADFRSGAGRYTVVCETPRGSKAEGMLRIL